MCPNRHSPDYPIEHSVNRHSIPHRHTSDCEQNLQPIDWQGQPAACLPGGSGPKDVYTSGGFMGHVVHLPPKQYFFKTRGHLSRLAWPTQRDGLSCLASPRLALRCAAWPGKTNPDPCSRPVVKFGCSHRYYNGIVHNARCINILFFSVRQAVFLYKHECLK